MNDDHCPTCGHLTVCHERQGGTAYRCVYTKCRHQCGCTEPNPSDLEQRRRDAALWNSHLCMSSEQPTNERANHAD